MATTMKLAAVIKNPGIQVSPFQLHLAPINLEPLDNDPTQPNLDPESNNLSTFLKPELDGE